VQERVAALELGGQVHVTGFLPNPFPVVRTLDVLAHPALRDPFPLALLEGMALARPIIASAVSGIPEMLADGESGVLVPPNDPEAMARGLLALLNDEPRRRALGEAARHRLRTRFSLDGFADTMFQAFDEAVDGEAA
jgi:glycosyltransferase involved in cell wall biosynthesis